MEIELGVDWGSVGARRWMRCTRDECHVIESLLVVRTDPGSESYRTPSLDGAVYRGLNVRYR